MFQPEHSYSKIIVYTQSITNAGTAHCLHEEEGLAKHVHLGGCLSGVCDLVTRRCHSFSLILIAMHMNKVRLTKMGKHGQ